MKKLKKFTLRLIAGANLATILAMAAVGYSDRVDPVAHPFVGSVGLVFPVLLVANFAFLVFWALVSVRRTSCRWPAFWSATDLCAPTVRSTFRTRCPTAAV